MDFRITYNSFNLFIACVFKKEADEERVVFFKTGFKSREKAEKYCQTKLAQA